MLENAYHNDNNQKYKWSHVCLDRSQSAKETEEFVIALNADPQ